MNSTTTQTDLVGLIAAEIAGGIDEAIDYWLGRIECELTDEALTPYERLRAVANVLREYKEVTGKIQFRAAEA